MPGSQGTIASTTEAQWEMVVASVVPLHQVTSYRPLTAGWLLLVAMPGGLVRFYEWRGMEMWSAWIVGTSRPGK